MVRFPVFIFAVWVQLPNTTRTPSFSNIMKTKHGSLTIEKNRESTCELEMQSVAWMYRTVFGDLEAHGQY